jgi:MCP family monocarboxylic acid transporter-like MFS transporter 10
MAFGCMTGLLEARIGTRPVLMIGSTICTISLIISSFAPSIEALFGTFSLLYGIGSSMAYTPTMCLSQVYFDKYVSLATGIMVAGSSFGTLVLSPIAQTLLENLGWRNSFRIFAAFLFTTVFFGALVKPVPISKANKRQQHSQSKQFLAELKIWKNRVFILWTIALALSFFGYFIIGVHLVRIKMCIVQLLAPKLMFCFIRVVPVNKMENHPTVYIA